MLLTNHIVYIQLCKCSSMSTYMRLIVVVAAKKSGALTRVLPAAQKTFTFGLSRTCSANWCEFCDPRVIRLWRIALPDKWNVSSSLQSILPENKLSLLKQFSISAQNLSHLVDHWVLAPAAVEICMERHTIVYVEPSILPSVAHQQIPCLFALRISVDYV
jgi:hypothetical protein